MALYTDGLYPSPADINAIVPALQQELSSEFADVTPAPTILNLCSEANSQCARIISSKLQSVIGATNFNPSGGATSLHNASIIWGVRAQSNVVRLRMGQIVMNDLFNGDAPTGSSLMSPLRSWLAHWGVTLGYRKLVGRAEPDRYLTKYNFYRKLTSNEQWPMLSSNGLPYVRVPFPAPGAIYETGSGNWSAANLTQTTVGGASATGLYYVAITWVDQTSQVFYVNPLTKNNSESGPSQILPTIPAPWGYTFLTLTSGNAITVSIAGLNPPTGAVNLPESSITGVSQGTHIATGWNIYVGQANPTDDSPGIMYLQNSVPVPVGTLTYTLPGNPLLSGYQLFYGQYADANMPLPTQLMMRM